MLLQLENINAADVNKLLAFARQNHLQLSVIDDTTNNYLLPGKPLTEEQLTALINESRKSGVLSMQNAHELIRTNYNAG
jgi:hypothetical protein